MSAYIPSLLSRHWIAFATLVLFTLGSEPAKAQVPFIGGGVTAFSPEISVVNSGILQDVQGTVSADRKYVTIGARPQNTQLLSLNNFTFQGAATAGIVGGVTPGGVAAVRPGLINPPVVLGAGAGIVLSQRGMTRIISSPVGSQSP